MKKIYQQVKLKDKIRKIREKKIEKLKGPFKKFYIQKKKGKKKGRKKRRNVTRKREHGKQKGRICKEIIQGVKAMIFQTESFHQVFSTINRGEKTHKAHNDEIQQQQPSSE